MNTTAPLRRVEKILIIRLVKLEAYLVDHPDDAQALLNHSVASAALGIVKGVLGIDDPGVQQKGITVGMLAEQFASVNFPADHPLFAPARPAGAKVESYAARKRRRAAERTA